ncbi:MAG: L-rhamnose isomerase, partial [Bacteroidales bacterium]|nr:L-rhamnose isomerase [Bacteroidales bacterium]
LKAYEESGKYFERLALLELMKTKPFGMVYDYYCSLNNVPVAEDYIGIIQKYEKEVLKKR